MQTPKSPFTYDHLNHWLSKVTDEYEDIEDSEELEEYCTDGFHPVILGERLKQGKYIVLRKLGWGHFSTVWLVIEWQTGEFRAVKIHKGKYSHKMQEELEIFEQLQTPQDLCVNKDPESTIKNTSKQDNKSKDKILDSVNDKLDKTVNYLSSEQNTSPNSVTPESKALLAKYDQGKSYLLDALDHFDHFGTCGNHKCIVYDVVGPSLLQVADFLQNSKNEGAFHLKTVQSITRQLSYGLEWMHCRNVVHTDLKMENVCVQISKQQILEMLERPAKKPTSMKFLKLIQTSRKKKKRKKKKKKKALQQVNKVDRGSLENQNKLDHPKNQNPTKFSISSDNQTLNIPPESLLEVEWQGSLLRLDKSHLQIKIVDFGNAQIVESSTKGRIQTMEYKCPETLFNLPWDCSADIWSLGCLVFELLTGDYLFKPKPEKNSNVTPEEDLVALMTTTLGKFSKEYLQKGGDTKLFLNKKGLSKTAEFLKMGRYPIFQILEEEFGFEEEKALDVDEFLVKLLEYEPSLRVCAKEVRKLPWLKEKSLQKD